MSRCFPIIACIFFLVNFVQAEPPNRNKKNNFKFDRFGQLNSVPWPGKVHSVQELQNDAKAEVAYYESLKLPPRDLYGGYPGTKETLGFTSTGFFHVGRANGRFYLVTPEGNAFFSIAAGGLFSYHDWVPMQKENRTLFAWTPAPDGRYAGAFFGDHKYFSFYVANWIRKYGRYNSLEWKKIMALRLKRWGFNTHNAYFRYAQISESAKLPMTIVLRVNGKEVIPRVNLFDVFDPEACRRVDENMAKAVSPYAEVPWIIGYYLDNEPKFYEFKNEIMKLEGTWAVKRALIDWLQKKYKTVSNLNNAWGINIKHFKELLPPQNKIKINKKVRWDLQAFRAVFLDRYFKFMQQTFRKHDPHHLILGYRFRWQDSRDKRLNQAVAPHVDVISDNYYAVKEFDKKFLMNMYKVSAKPRILSEWSYDAADCGLPGQIRHVATQTIRGIGYRQYQEQAAGLPFVVGTQWWCMQDHQKGLVNTGLISVTDRPYKTFLTYVRRANLDVEAIILDGQAPFVSPLSQVGLRDHKKDFGWTNWRDLRAEYTNFTQDNQVDHPEIQQK